MSVTIELPNGGSIKLEGASKDVTESTLAITQLLTATGDDEVEKNKLTVDPLLEDGTETDDLSDSILDLDNIPKIDRLKFLVRSKLPHGWFNSKEAFILYKDVIEEISFSTVSTYLKRLTESEVLVRKGEKKNMIYRVNPKKRDIIPVYAFKLETRKLVRVTTDL